MREWRLALSALLISPVVACTQPAGTVYPQPSAGPPVSLSMGVPPPINGGIGAARLPPSAEVSLGSGPQLAGAQGVASAGVGATVGPVSLDFADTDIRE